jgi:MFS family permease
MTKNTKLVPRDHMFYRFSAYGFLKNLRFFEPFILLIFRANGLTFLQIGILYSVRDIAINILEVPTGVLADSFGRRKAMVSGFLSYILSFLILYFFQNYWILILAMILFGCGEAFRSGTHKALILEYLKIKGISDLKVAYYGLTRSASQLGSAVNALAAAGLVLATGNYRVIFLATVIPYALDLVNLALYPQELDGVISSSREVSLREQVRTTVKGFVQVFRDQFQLRPLLNSASYSAAFKTVKDYLQPLLAAWALSIALFPGLDNTKQEALLIGLVYFGIFLLTSIASRNAYQVSQLFPNPRTAVNITYLIGVALLVVSGLTSAFKWQWLAVLCFVGIFLINNLRRPINVGVISDQISSRIMASGLSAESQITTILTAAFAPLLGYVADKLGQGIGILVLGLVMLALYFLVRVLEGGGNGE